MHALLNFHIWLWFWFLFGSGVYILKRAYYLVTGPNPVAESYPQFFEKCWIPLLVRLVVDSGIYWLTFYPDLLNGVLSFMSKLGWNVQLHSPIPQYAVVALFFGLSIDSIVDFAVTKIPYVKDWLPQMPAPMKRSSNAAPEVNPGAPPTSQGG